MRLLHPFLKTERKYRLSVYAAQSQGPLGKGYALGPQRFRVWPTFGCILSYMRTLSTFLFLSAFALGVSQQDYHRSNAIPVVQSGDEVLHAWAGGFNSNQWNTFDLDEDGLEDIVVYDRTSDVIRTFLQTSLGEYQLSFDYADQFPKVENWLLLRDFNCDGKKDVFTSAPGGIRLYENISDGADLNFQLRSSLLPTFFDFGVNPFYSNLYVSGIDIPSIEDFDGDGDLDIHTFTLAGQTIEYHEGHGVDIGNCDSLEWRLSNRCYAMTGEDAISPVIYIGQEFIDGEFCGFNVPDPKSSDRSAGRHAGSTLCTFDYDGNGQKDLLIGDISANNLAMILIDDRGDLQDSAFAVELDFPSNDIPVDIKVFNAAFYEDLTGDGIRDLIVSPANSPDSEDKDSNWLYVNSGTDDAPVFQRSTTAFIQEEAIDVGSLSFPRVIDVDGDGDLDLIIGNRGAFQTDGTYEESIHYYENVGSDSEPSLVLMDIDLWSLNALGLQGHIAPSFGDMDEDGDIDMYLGDGQGRLHYFENDQGPGQFMDFAEPILLDIDGQVLDLGANLIPQIFDLDQDGLLDLIVGERNGNINYLRNMGNSMEPIWELTNDSLGNIITDLDGNLVGYSAPWFYYDENEDMVAVIGTETGDLFYLEDIPSYEVEQWSISDSSAFGIANGERACPTTVDWNGDGIVDFINGDHSGGLSLYLSGTAPESVFESMGTSLQWALYPNPANDLLLIESLIPKTNPEPIEVQVFDIQGRLISSKLEDDTGDIRLDISRLGQGSYLVRLISDSRPVTLRFVKQ